MKANELRIGNWIKYEDKLVQVVQLSSLMILCQRDENQFLVNCAPKEFQPIELTEEVLVKIGFEDRKGYFNYSRVFGDENNYCDSIHIYYCAPLKHFRFTHDKVKADDLQKMDLYNIQYLHQLQNAYYCLTGQELEVEL